jgi:hypothetical protein
VGNLDLASRLLQLHNTTRLAPIMPQPRLAGTLSLYPLPNSSWGRRPYFTSGDEGADRAVVFVGGLHAGLLDAPSLVPLSRAVGAAGWRL